MALDNPNISVVIKESIENIRQHQSTGWDDKVVISRFVSALESEDELVSLEWLCLFVSRRVLTCWDHFCDNKLPHNQVREAEIQINNAQSDRRFGQMYVEAIPAYRTRPIVDCRYASTASAAESVFSMMTFLVTRNPNAATDCIVAADIAFDESPLRKKDNFREWLLDFAIPLALENRDINLQQREALRTYQKEEIPLIREKERTHAARKPPPRMP